MPQSGTGKMSPFGGGAPSAGILVPLPLTCLSINHFAKVMGINPAHFWGVTAASLNPVIMPVETCGSIYHQYSWQDSDKVSRFDIASEIAKAESNIAEALHYWPGPTWISEEEHVYPGYHRRELFGLGIDNRYMLKSIRTNYGKIIQTGKRLATLLSSPSVAAGTLAYIDDDSDGMFETARVRITTALTDIREIRIFFTGMSGAPEFEIREPRKVTISGGVATLYFDSWLFTNPELYELPTNVDNDYTIDISTVSNFVTAVDAYRITSNPADEAAEFYWRNENVGCAVCGGVGCDACGLISQDGCATIRNAEEGSIVTYPASYSVADGWTGEDWSGSREPDRVKLWYQCGLQSEAYLAGRSANPMGDAMARIIAHLAASRFERPLCGCSNVQSLSDRLRKDAVNTEGSGGMFFSTINLVNNPFGTRMGEIEAWRDLTKLVERRSSVAVI